MRNKIKQLLTLALFASTCQMASAYDFEVDGIYYEITSETDHTVSTTYKTKEGNTEYVDVTIPETVQYNGAEYFVTSVGEGSFFKCSNLRSVTLPNSVTSIGIYAFHECFNLSSINMPSNLTSIGHHAFGACSNLTSFVIPDGVTSIEEWTFAGCNGLAAITIPESVKYIGWGAFGGCNSLTSIEIPEGVTSIESSTFSACHALASVSIPNSVTKIESDAFVGCIALSSVEIPEGVMSIGENAFEGCTILTSINIPESVTDIPDNPFNRCRSLPIIDGIRYADTYLVESVDPTASSITIKEGTRFIGNISRHTNLSSITIPNGVISIGSRAFQDNNQLQTITIPESVSYIGTWAFLRCSSLASINVGSVNYLSSDAFEDCNSLVSIYVGKVPPTVKNQYDETSKLVGLDKSACILYVPYGSIPTYRASESWNDFENIVEFGPATNVITYTSTDGQVVVPYNENAFGANIISNTYENGVGTITFDGDVTSIGFNAFYSCNTLESIGDLPACTNIGESAFFDCSALTNVGDLGDCTSIGNYAFWHCNALTSLGVLSSCTNIGAYAFSECLSLSSFTIPASVINIGESAFMGCTGIKNLIIEDSTEELNLGTCMGKNGFFDAPFSHCPLETLYQGRTLISKYGTFERQYNLTNVEISHYVTSIGDNAFRNCNSLTSVSDLGSCTNIGSYAFYGCSSLASVGDLGNCTSIGSYAFYGCSALTSVDLSASTSISNYAFYDCSSLTSVGDLGGCTSIGSYAFYNCGKISDIGSLTSCISVGDYAFYDCYSLQYITEFSRCESIGDYAFSGCKSLWEAAPLMSCISIGIHAFLGCHDLEAVGELSSCVSIGDAAFYECNSLGRLVIPNTTMAEIPSVQSISKITTVLVPNDLLSEYKNAENWKELSSRIIAIGSEPEVVQHVTMQEKTSGLHAAIGEENLANVIELKVIGDINSYDIGIIRDKMPNLHFLDLSEARIRANEYKYYGNYSTTDDVLGAYSFYGLRKLLRVVLPNSIMSVGSYAFSNCSYLQEVNIPLSAKSISHYAFNYCEALTEISIPSDVTFIGVGAFYDCLGLQSVHFATNSKLTDIYDGAFGSCNQLKSLDLPNSVSYIASGAFSNCSGLTEIHLPTSLNSVGNNAFDACTSLRKVYASAPDAYAVAIQDESFAAATREQGTLYVPFDEETGWRATYDTYYWQTQWKRFLNIAKWRPDYDRFPIDNDYDQETGTIPGEEIDANFGTNAGYILGEEAYQHFKTVVLKCNASKGGSIIVKGNKNISIGELFPEIEVSGNKWYFFCFPFDIKLSDVTCGVDGRFVFRKYDSAARADGGTGWTNLAADEEWLKAGVGYIFQCNKAGTLRLPILDPQFADADKSPELEAHPAANDQDASWNFVGNPYLSYYQLEDLGFDAPVTYWNGTSYVAVRPGDDDYVFQPYQAFFVQKPTDTQTVGFDGANQQTYTQSQNALAHARERRARQRINPDRLIINVTLSDGENTDQTRVVYNNETSASYEMACDASKFMSTEAVPQLFSVGGDVQYAINERPHGEVSLGYKVSKAGTYTISMTRMDTPMLLKDLKTGVTFDFTIGEDYVFEAEAGTCTNRFVLLLNPNTDRIENMTIADAENAQFYNLAGQRTDGDSDAIQIMKQGESAKKVMIK